MQLENSILDLSIRNSRNLEKSFILMLKSRNPHFTRVPLLPLKSLGCLISVDPCLDRESNPGPVDN